jgi:hypothetical protein
MRFAAWPGMSRILLCSVKMAAVTVFLFAGAKEGRAMGDIGSSLAGFMQNLIESYWYPSLDVYHAVNIENISKVATPIPGEDEQTGFQVPQEGTVRFRPTRDGTPTCDVFNFVRISDVPGKEINFRTFYLKSAIHYEVRSGWFNFLGPPVYAKFWLGAILPKNAEPLFNEGGIGLNRRVLSRPFIDQIGYAEGFPDMPPERFRLLDTVQCDGFSIFVVEYD